MVSRSGSLPCRSASRCHIRLLESSMSVHSQSIIALGRSLHLSKTSPLICRYKWTGAVTTTSFCSLEITFRMRSHPLFDNAAQPGGSSCSFPLAALKTKKERNSLANDSLQNRTCLRMPFMTLAALPQIRCLCYVSPIRIIGVAKPGNGIPSLGGIRTD